MRDTDSWRFIFAKNSPIPDFICKLHVTDIFAAFYIRKAIIAKIKRSRIKDDLQYVSDILHWVNSSYESTPAFDCMYVLWQNLFYFNFTQVFFLILTKFLFSLLVQLEYISWHRGHLALSITKIKRKLKI